MTATVKATLATTVTATPHVHRGWVPHRHRINGIYLHVDTQVAMLRPAGVAADFLSPVKEEQSK